jgi:Sulfotransferase family
MAIPPTSTTTPDRFPTTPTPTRICTPTTPTATATATATAVTSRRHSMVLGTCVLFMMITTWMRVAVILSSTVVQHDAGRVTKAASTIHSRTKQDYDRLTPTLYMDASSQQPPTQKRNQDRKKYNSTSSSASSYYRQQYLHRKRKEPKELIQPHDFIYHYETDRWDAAPIVVEKYKLVFFTIPKVACTTFKQLFRRMMGLPDWKSQDPTLLLPHNPATNGLHYLWNYSIAQANSILSSPHYTKAVFVRDPKSRFLSAFLDKGLGNFENFIQNKCCPTTTHSCVQQAKTSEGFFQLIQNCSDSHWDPQYHRMEAKFWPFINFVGHFEELSKDGPALLQRLGAWDDYKYGWGADGNATLFDSPLRSSFSQTHMTQSSNKIWQWLTPSLERKIEAYYQDDYQQRGLFGFDIKNLTKDG